MTKDKGLTKEFSSDALCPFCKKHPFTFADRFRIGFGKSNCPQCHSQVRLSYPGWFNLLVSSMGVILLYFYVMPLSYFSPVYWLMQIGFPYLLALLIACVATVLLIKLAFAGVSRIVLTGEK